jgi:hypothetical protein
MKSHRTKEDETELQQIVETLYKSKAKFLRSIAVEAYGKVNGELKIHWKGDVLVFGVDLPERPGQRLSLLWKQSSWR